MRTIYKYPLWPSEVVEISMPVGAEVLYAGVQHGTICLWALVDGAAPFEQRKFAIVGTGHDAGKVNRFGSRYVGTVLMDPFVWHVFDLSAVTADAVT